MTTERKPKPKPRAAASVTGRVSEVQPEQQWLSREGTDTKRFISLDPNLPNFDYTSIEQRLAGTLELPLEPVPMPPLGPPPGTPGQVVLTGSQALDDDVQKLRVKIQKPDMAPTWRVVPFPAQRGLELLPGRLQRTASGERLAGNWLRRFAETWGDFGVRGPGVCAWCGKSTEVFTLGSEKHCHTCWVAVALWMFSYDPDAGKKAA